MYKVLIYCSLIYGTTSSPPPLHYHGPTTENTISPKSEVEVFGPLYPGALVPKPKPLPSPPSAYPPKAPPYPFPTSTAKPSISRQPYPPTYYPKNPSWTPIKPTVTTKIPSIYPSTPNRPNFPPPIYPSFAGSNTTGFRPVYTESRNFFTTKSTIPSTTKWTTPRSISTPKTTRVTPSTFTPKRPTSTIPRNTFNVYSTTVKPSTSTKTIFTPKWPSSTIPRSTFGVSGTTVTPAWIYPPRPSYPRRVSNLEQVPESSNDNVVVTEAFTEKRNLLTGVISDYKSYNEEDGSFSLEFQLQNGLSAKVHGYKKNGKQVIEGSYSLFTEDGKPVNVIYKADDINDQEAEPTIFHVDIPINLNYLDENYDVDSIPTFSSRNDGIFVVGEPQDEELSDFILNPTTESDVDGGSTTEAPNHNE